MACEITITGVFGLGPAPSVIRVVGTVSDCPPDVDGNNLVVGVSCASPDGPFIERSTQAAADGTWQALIPLDATSRCRCDRPIVVQARCTTAENCVTELRVGELACPDCPVITFPGPGGDDVFVNPIVVECNPDGTGDCDSHLHSLEHDLQLPLRAAQPGPRRDPGLRREYWHHPGASFTGVAVCG